MDLAKGKQKGKERGLLTSLKVEKPKGNKQMVNKELVTLFKVNKKIIELRNGGGMYILTECKQKGQLR